MATWYSRQTANINAVNVWNETAVAPDGAWLTWADLAVGDVLVANGFTLTINVGFTCAQINTETSGGGFTLAAGITFTANVLAGTTTCLTRTAAGAASVITGSVTVGSTNTTIGVFNNSTGDITVTGSSTGGGGTTCIGCYVNSTGGITIEGASIGGAGGAAIGARKQGAGNLTVGSATGGSGASSHGVIINNATGVTRVLGNSTGHATTATSDGVHCTVAANVYIGGDVTKVAGQGFDTTNAGCTLHLNGTGAQVYTNASATTIGNVTIAKASGTFTYASAMTCVNYTVTGPANIAGAFTITATGNLSLSGTQANRIYINGPDFAVTGTAAATWCSFKNSASTGTVILAASCFDAGGNSGIWFETISTADIGTSIEAILTARGLTLPASDAADTVLRRGASVVTGTTLDALVNDVPTNTEFAARTLLAAGYATPTNITAGTITTVTTVTTTTNLTNAPTNGDLTAAMKLSVNAEVDAALNTAIPVSPTADSINERVATMDAAVAAITVEVAKIPRKGYQVTGENVTVGGDYTGEIETVAYTEVEVTT